MDVYAFLFFNLLFTVYFSVVRLTFFPCLSYFHAVCCLRTDGKAVGKQLFDSDTGFISQKIKNCQTGRFRIYLAE